MPLECLDCLKQTVEILFGCWMFCWKEFLDSLWQNVGSSFVVFGCFGFLILDKHLHAWYDPRKLEKSGISADKFLEDLFK